MVDTRTPQPQNPVEVAKQAVMTAEEYAQTRHERPYVYTVEVGGKTVTYFAPGHSWDPESPIWEQLRRAFESANPDMTVVEGFGDLSRRKQEVIQAAGSYSEADVIGKSGEAGFALKLAAEGGIDFDSPEPPLGDEIRYLEEQGMSREAIFAYYIFRMVPQWHQHAEKEDFREFIQREINAIQEASQWEDFDYSYEHVERIAQHFWGGGINLDNPEYYEERVDPIPWAEKKDQQTDVNLAARHSSRFRDQYIIGKIAEYLETHDRIFIVYGASHAVMQEPGIRKLLEEYA